MSEKHHSRDESGYHFLFSAKLDERININNVQVSASNIYICHTLYPYYKCVFLSTAEFLYLDLTSLKSVRQFVQTFKSRGLPLHVLVNNGTLPSAVTFLVYLTPPIPPTRSYAHLNVPPGSRLRSWDHAGSREADGGRFRVPLFPQLPGPLPVDQPAAGHPEEVGPTRTVLQDSQHVLRYALLWDHAHGRLKQEVGGRRAGEGGAAR